jgi:hypothetical protein
VRAVSLALRFLLEIIALVVLGAWGLGLDAPLPVRLGAAAGAVLSFAVIWGLLIAPKARWRIRDPAKVVLEIALFAVAALCLGWPLGIVFFAVILLSEGLTFALGQRAS